MVRSIRDSFKDKQDLLFENEELKAELDSLTTQNNQTDPGSGGISETERTLQSGSDL